MIRRWLLGIALMPMIVLCGFSGFVAGLFFTWDDGRRDAAWALLLAIVCAAAAFGLLRLLVTRASARPGAAMAVLVLGCVGTGWAVGATETPAVAAVILLLLVPTVLGVLRGD